MKKLAVVCLCVCLACTVMACGKKAAKGQKESTDKKTEQTTEDKDLEEVTELEKEGNEITFEEIEHGLNFKAQSSSVTFEFQDMDAFDNSLGMAFSLTSASGDGAAKEVKISDKKTSYTFKNMKKGEKYYLEAYPTKEPGSGTDYEKIAEHNSSCKLLIQQ